MSLVSLVKIPKEYSYPTKQEISRSLKLIAYSFDHKIKRVVIKPNLCYYWDCSTGQTTEPRFVSELIDLIREQISADVDIAIVESDASAMRCKYASDVNEGYSSFNQPHFDELQYFVDCLVKDEAPSPTGLDGLRDLEAISRAYKNQIIL